MSPEHREVAELLLQKARDDLNAARLLVATEGQAAHIVGFHLQQATEKALKSILASREIEIPYTHDLEELLQRLSDTGTELPAALAAAEWLTPWGVVFRYDDQSDDLDVDSGLAAATAAIGLAEHTIAKDDSDPAA